jgi:hypothetical protein
MIDVMLSYPDPVTRPATDCEMSVEVFTTLLDVAEREIQGRLALHVDWRKPPYYLETAIQHIAQKNVHFTACFYTSLSKDWLQKMLHAGASIALSIQSLAQHPLQEIGAIFKQQTIEPPMSVGIFIPLPQPDFEPFQFQPLLDAGLPIQSVVLAVGWKDCYSGPLPLDKKDHGMWARSLERSITRFTQGGLTTRIGCGLPLCLFTREQLGHLARQKIRLPLAHCDPNGMVLPDGALRACHRLDLPRPQTLCATTDLSRTVDEIEQRLKPFHSLCPHSEQLVCRSAVCGACGCGCLTTIMASWQKCA